MKKHLIILAALLFITNAAFSRIQFGISTMAGTKSKTDYKNETSINGGFNTRLKIDLFNNIFLSSGFSYYLPYKYNFKGDNYTFYNSVLNADLNYNFLDNGEIVLYGLGGINLDMLNSKSIIHSEEFKQSESSYDLEFGVGIRIEICYAEIKFDNNKEQIQIFIGIDL